MGAEMFTNPVLDGCADPDVIYYEGTYYLYATNTDMKDDSEMGFKVYTSQDLVHWTDRGMALKACDSWGEKQFWAPDIIFTNNTFYLSYSVEEHLCIATSKSPLGPFIQEVKKPLHEDIKEIDSHFFQDTDGTWYLYFVRFFDSNQIWGAEMTGDLLGIREDTLTRLLVPDTPWECIQWPVNEAPYMLLHKGLYYLTYSGSHCLSSYGSGYAVAASPLGEFTKYENNPILRSNDKVHGVGHHCITWSPDHTRMFIVYHQHYDRTKMSPRRLCVDRIRFEEREGGPDILVVDGPSTDPQPLFFQEVPEKGGIPHGQK